MINESEKVPKNAEIPADVAEAWAAVILDLAIRADTAGEVDLVDGNGVQASAPKNEIGGWHGPGLEVPWS